MLLFLVLPLLLLVIPFLVFVELEVGNPRFNLLDVGFMIQTLSLRARTWIA
jgi:hypothetical protein